MKRLTKGSYSYKAISTSKVELSFCIFTLKNFLSIEQCISTRVPRKEEVSPIPYMVPQKATISTIFRMFRFLQIIKEVPEVPRLEKKFGKHCSIEEVWSVLVDAEPTFVKTQSIS